MISIFAARSAAKPLADALQQCRQHLVQAAVFSALLNMLFLAPAIYMMQVYDRVVPTRGVETLVLLTIIFLFAIGTLAALDWLRARLLVRAAARLDRLLVGDVLKALIAMPDRERNSAGSVLREFDTFRQTMTGPSVTALFDAPWSPIYILVCFLLHPLIGLFALVCSATLLVIGYLNERAIKDALLRAMTDQQAAYRSIEGTLRVGGIVRALGMQNGLVSRHLKERSAATTSQAQTAFVSARYVSIIKAARIAMQSLALGLGALLAIDQQISAGAIFASALLLSRALAPLESITAAWRNTVQARQALDGLNAVFLQQDRARTATQLPSPVGKIDIEHLTVKAPDETSVILHDINIKIAAGEFVGIVGPSGAGKSTLLKAIVGELRADSGLVRLDGAALADWPDDQRTVAFGHVPQEPSLLSGSIKANIARFQTETTDDMAKLDREVVRVAKLCGAHEFILRLPQAYETVLQSSGAGLSVGQAQRIALARALFGSPSVILLDEPNAHLDAEGENQLLATLADLKRQKVTIIMAAHRLRVLEGSDKLLVLKSGHAERFGKTDQIIKRISSEPQNIEVAKNGPLAA
ncbi:MAG: type I secretion system permease/ATPase [Sphingorhabdus sp.]